MLRRLALVVAVPVVALVAACGGAGSGAGGDADPAAAVPSGAVFYAEAVLRPEGSVRDDALAAAGRILGTSDPQARIRELLQQTFASGGTKVDYAKDIEPWLGTRAGLWLSMPAGAGAGGAPGVGAVIAVRDADRARSSIDALAKRDGSRLAPRTVGAHDYEVASDGTAIAVEGDYAIVGTEGEVRRGLSTLDGDGLAANDAYRKAIAPLDDHRLAHWYLDMKALMDAALRADPAASSQLGPLQGLVTSAMAGGTQVGSISADGKRLTAESIDPATGGLLSRLYGLTGRASPLLERLPGDAWAAVAVPNAGEALHALFTGFAGVLGGVAATEQLRREYGIDLERDVFSWVGDAGVFVRGTRPDAIDGALVLEVTDEARAAAAFGKLVGLLRTRGGLDPQPVRIDGADSAFAARPAHAPKPLVFARGNGRVVAAYGPEAAAAGLSPSSTLGGSAALGAARDALDGYAPAGFVSLPSVLSLVEAGGAGGDPRWDAAKGYLRALSVAAWGSRQDGDNLRSRLAIGLR